MADDPSHPLGCHRPRISDRIIFDKLLQVLRFGCSYQGVTDTTCSATTIRNRRDEWIRAGVVTELKRITMESYDPTVGRSVGSSLSGSRQPSTVIRADLGRASITTWCTCSARCGAVPRPGDHAAVTTRMQQQVYRGVSGVYYFGARGPSALTYPDDTLDPSLAQAHLVHQVQSGCHVVVAPAPYQQGVVQPPS